jgi:hypothetical protein
VRIDARYRFDIRRRPMKYEIVGRSLLAISLACLFAGGCGSDSGEWIDAIVDAHDGHHGGGPDDTPECPDICGAICAGLPEPELPPGCPIPGCSCGAPAECPDICEPICAGLPEPELPLGCPIPACACD